jgi:hypothetical protein
MNRRNFVRLSAYGTVLLGVPFVAGCSYKPVNGAINQPPFLVQFMDKKTITDTGHFYLKLIPDENSSNKLESLLTANSGITGSTEPKKVHAYFDGQSIADFNANKTVIVDGWVLSATEARQCALFSLSET